MNSSAGTPHLVRDTQFNDMTTIFDEMTMREYVQKRAAESLIGVCLGRLFLGHREILGRSSRPQRTRALDSRNSNSNEPDSDIQR